MIGRLLPLAVLLAGCQAACSGPRLHSPVPLWELEERVLADSNDAAAHYAVALGYWARGRWERAEAALREAVALDSKLAPGYLALAYLPYARRPQLWEEALEGRVPAAWQEAVEASDRFFRRAFMVDPFVDLRIAGAARPPGPAWWDTDEELQRSRDDWNSSLDDLLAGRYEAAYEKLGRLRAAFERRGVSDRQPAGQGEPGAAGRVPAAILWHHAMVAARIRRFDEASAGLSLLLARSPDAEAQDEIMRLPLRPNDYRYLLAAVKQRAGDVREAVQLYREALQEDLGLYMAHVQLASIHERRGRWSAAIEERRRAVESNPGDAALVYDLGTTLYRAGREADAEEALREAIALNPRDYRPYYVLGLATAEQGKHEAAREAFDRFLELAPGRMTAADNTARHRRIVP